MQSGNEMKRLLKFAINYFINYRTLHYAKCLQYHIQLHFSKHDSWMKRLLHTE